MQLSAAKHQLEQYSVLAIYKQKRHHKKTSFNLTVPGQAFYMPFGLNELPQPQLPSAFGFCTTCAANCSISTELHMPRSTRHTHQHGVLGMA